MTAQASRDCLPLDLSTFVNRTRELAQVVSLCQRSRLLTLTGPGGVGKSRLAVSAARSLQDVFRDGVYLADVAPLAEPDRLPGLVASSLGLRGGPDQTSVAGLADELGDHEALLILDTCEHLLDPCAELALELLARCPGVTILATSRERLGLSSEPVWPVPPLGTPEPGLSLRALAANESVQLFVARAAEVVPHFALHEANAGEVAEICRRLEGLPLALELAAARLGVLVLPQILDQLDDPLRLLARGVPVGPDRHRSLRVTLDWSVALLGDPQRRLLRRLGVFSGSWNLNAARAVCADDPALLGGLPELVAELAAASLIQVLPGRRLTNRYRLPNLVRSYALEQLVAAGEVSQVGRLHAEWYRRVAETVNYGDGLPEQIEHVAIDEGNLRAALAWAVSQQDLDLGFSLAARLYGLWFMLGNFREARASFARLLALPGGSPPAAAMLAIWASNHALAEGDFPAAQELAAQALASAEATGDPGLRAQALDALAEIMLGRGDLEQAQATLRVERELLQGVVALEWLHPSVVSRLAALALEAGSVAEAEGLARQALADTSDEGNLWIRLRALRVLGCAALEYDDVDTAAEHYARCLAWAQQINDRPGTVQLMVDLAGVARRRMDLAAGRRLLRDALRRAQAIGEPLVLILVNEGIAGLLAAARPEAAVLLAAAAAFRRERLGAARWPRQARAMEQVHEVATSRLSPATIERAAAAGERLDDAAVVATAFAMLGSVEPRPAGRTGTLAGDGLTGRELEVAHLLGEGLANRAIADALVVSEGTVRAHVERVLGKLGLRSRAEIVEWLEQQDSSVSEAP